jgi:hypothetical protein
VAPLTAPASPDDRSGASSSAPTTASPSGVDPEEHLDDEQRSGDSSSADTAPQQRDRAHAITLEVLDGYGVVLTELAADPALDLGRFAARWSSVADPTSAFSHDMLNALTSRVRDDQMVVRPGPGGRSYVHRPTRITAVDDDAIDFTWCGYSPGIGVHIVTGEVLDDAVGHAAGTGRLVRDGQRWLLDTLDQEQLTVLPPGSGDPCSTGGAR